jgi:hypothetical protein
MTVGFRRYSAAATRVGLGKQEPKTKPKPEDEDRQRRGVGMMRREQRAKARTAEYGNNNSTSSIVSVEPYCSLREVANTSITLLRAKPAPSVKSMPPAALPTKILNAGMQ